VDGRPAYQLTYHSKKRDDLTIRLYFDAETYRHVLTTYSITLAQVLAVCALHLRSGGPDVPFQRSGSRRHPERQAEETRYTIEEEFSDFKTAEGLTLLEVCDPFYFRASETERLTCINGTLPLTRVSNNRSLDPRNFQVK